MRWIQGLFQKTDNKAAKKSANNILDWQKDKYESLVIQRNLLFVVLAASILIIGISVFTIRYIRSSQTIEPFIIEIERKTGVPTVVDPVSVKAYSADEAVKRYFVMKYIKAREGYLSTTFEHNYYDVMRVLSTDDVYYSNYRPKFNPSNPNSPHNVYEKVFQRRVYLKSMIFPSDNSAQVRIETEVSGGKSGTTKVPKIVYMEFHFTNISMNDQERLINPLGFQVTLYRIDDERNRA